MKLCTIIVLAQALAISAEYCGGKFTFNYGEKCNSGKTAYCCIRQELGPKEGYETQRTCEPAINKNGQQTTPQCDGGQSAGFCCN
ncbi:molybdopterin oxidoreductase [Marssonina coronariae]|uniref:Molybdopterin oxidoreductase n=1 Tax=Diplocarpon coronariae TaxID=2795749 RepID=A0A218YSW7_9HELO|nr:molybdopterin oxidoreductase [Marssonina coronariae]